MTIKYCVIDKGGQIVYSSDDKDSCKLYAYQLGNAFSAKKLYICELDEELFPF